MSAHDPPLGLRPVMRLVMGRQRSRVIPNRTPCRFESTRTVSGRAGPGRLTLTASRKQSCGCDSVTPMTGHRACPVRLHLPSSVTSIIRRHTPVATLINDVYVELGRERRSAHCPRDDIEALLRAAATQQHSKKPEVRASREIALMR